MKKRFIAICLIIIVIFSIIFKNTKALAQISDVVDIVTSKDNIDVPVPVGFVASPFEDEQYVNGLSTRYYITNETNLEFYEEILVEDISNDQEAQDEALDDPSNEDEETTQSWTKVLSSDENNVLGYDYWAKNPTFTSDIIDSLEIKKIFNKKNFRN